MMKLRGDSMEIFVLFAMFFCHIVDDYYLQGILAKLKQKSWWKENYPDKMYEYDYLMALIEHAFSWSFMIMLPIAIHMYKIDGFYAPLYIITIIANTLIHSFVDHLKANCKVINLSDDQLLHFTQIIITWLFYCHICLE